MSTYPSLPLFTDAFIADTVHLSAQETGAYLMLMMVAWRSPECQLPDNDDKLARWARVDRRTWARIKPAVMEFWTVGDGFWTQKRLSKEREFVSKRAEVNRRNGEHGGRPKSLISLNAANPAGSVRVSETKAPNPTPKRTPIVPKGTDPEGFEEFWKAYPKRDGDNSRKTAARAYAKVIGGGIEPAALLRAVKAMAAEMQAKGKAGTELVPMAATWLNQGRFERFTEASGAQPGSPPSDPDAFLAGLTEAVWA